MRDYGVVYCKIWTDPKFKSFKDHEKVLFIYLLTNEHSNLLGCYRLPLAYMADDLGWDLKKIKDTVSTLCQHGVVTVDTDLSWVFIPKYLKYNPLKNESCGKSVQKIFDLLSPQLSFYDYLSKTLIENPAYLSVSFLSKLDTVSTQCRHSVDYSTSTSTSTSTSNLINLSVDSATASNSKNQNCPYEEIFGLYHEILPMGSVVKVINSARKRTILARWREDKEHQNLEFWRWFFEKVRKSKFLLGKVTVPGKAPFALTLDKILSPGMFAKIIEGFYERDDNGKLLTSPNTRSELL